MMIKRISVLGCGLLWLAGCAAFAWTPSECDQDLGQSWAAHEQRVRTAEVGSPLYAPKPFPRSADQVVEDLRYGYLKMWRDTDFSKFAPYTEEAEQVYDGFENGDLHFDITRVENWSADRCRPERQKSFHYLIRIFLTDGTTEVARATVNEDGLIGPWHYRPTDEVTAKLWATLLRSPSEIQNRVSTDLGIPTSKGQLVQTTGTVHCSLLEPCVALRSGRGILLVDRQGDVFEVADEAKRFSRREATHPDTRGAVMQGRTTGDERVVSLGNDFAVAIRIGRIQ